MKALALCLALMLCGCSLATMRQDRAIRDSQPYRAGYSAGCAAANAAGSSYRYGPVRDEQAFRNNDVYRAGWNNGYSACRRTISPPGSEPGQPIPEPSPGH